MPAPIPRKTPRAFGREALSFMLALGLVAAGLLFAPARPASAQVFSAGVRISQIYTRGGEPGAAFRDDFIELFNAGPSPVELNGWELHIATLEGSVTRVVSAPIFSAAGGALAPGRYMLLRLAGDGASGEPLPAPDADLDFGLDLIKLGAEGGRIALLQPNTPDPPSFTCPELPSNGVEDYVGYGAAGCSEGNAPAPAPGLTTSIKRQGNGCVDANLNDSDFLLAPAAPRNRTAPAFVCAGSQSLFSFSPPQFFVSEDEHRAQIRVARFGDLSAPATVDYATADGTASERRDYTTALGTLRFAPGEESKTFDVLVNEDAFADGLESVNLVLSNPTGGAALGFNSTASLVLRDGPVLAPSGNPNDVASVFVRQHYHDFLNREPDAGGLGFWTQGIETCATPACVSVKRVDTSAAFFLSIEFQETGFLVYRAYKAALPESAARPRALPRYREFVRDTSEVGRGIVVGSEGWQQRLASNRRAFLAAFVARPEFEAEYPLGMPAADYVSKLNARAGGPLSPEELAALIAGLLSGAETRASVLGRVADHPNFVRAEFNRAFVLMQYFGYLRRNPDDAPDANFNGYDFWLGKLNQFNGNYRRAEMVRAFLESIEYRQRFGQ